MNGWIWSNLICILVRVLARIIYIVKKSVYLMAPTAMQLSAHEILSVCDELGVPTQNVKVHPDCQLDTSIDLADERRAEWDEVCMKRLWSMKLRSADIANSISYLPFNLKKNDNNKLFTLFWLQRWRRGHASSSKSSSACEKNQVYCI